MKEEIISKDFVIFCVVLKKQVLKWEKLKEKHYDKYLYTFIVKT